MNESEPTPPDSGPPKTWAVHRQDDNGNRFVVQTGLRREEAERLAAEFETRAHKQVYWVEPDLSGGRDAGRRPLLSCQPP